MSTTLGRRDLGGNFLIVSVVFLLAAKSSPRWPRIIGEYLHCLRQLQFREIPCYLGEMLSVGHKRQRALILALLASLLLWNLPFGGLVLYPFKLLATWLHEMSHGLLMIFTGAGFHHLEIFQDTSGIAQAEQGVSDVGRAAIHSSGYMGTALFGALLLVVGQTRGGARSLLASLGAALGISAVVWIQNDFGQAAAYIGMAICISISLVPSERLAILVVNFVAVEACINALLDIRVLFRTEMVINGIVVESASDAHNMADVTFGSYSTWASIWLLWSCLCFFVALRVVFLRHQSTSERKNYPDPPGLTRKG